MDIAAGRCSSIATLLLYRSAVLLFYVVGLGSADLLARDSRLSSSWSSLP
jgi:hypothetical protein